MPLFFKTKNKFLIFRIYFLVFETRCMLLFEKKNTDSSILEIQYSI